MLIPSIDLMGGRIVQLVQGERLALESHAIDEWIERFAGWPKVQLIDLDAAKSAGTQQRAGRRGSARRCPAGSAAASGRSSAPSSVLDGGATHAIVGSALFKGGSVDLAFAEALAGRGWPASG